MSLLQDLWNGLNTKKEEDFTLPTSLCPGNCPLGPERCEECRPYKERLKDSLYNVDHLEEFYARYEVTSGLAAGAVACPYCGAPSQNRIVCEYCGMAIGTDDGKIRVASANDIPDPIIEAQDIIYARHSEIVAKYTDSSSGGLLANLLDLFDGDGSDDLGQRMSKEEIEEAAGLYGVSISAYLNGLDNGVYKTLSRRKAADAAGTVAGTAVGIGSGGVLSSLLNTSANTVNQRPARPQSSQRPPMDGHAGRPHGRPGGRGEHAGDHSFRGGPHRDSR